MGNVHRPPTKHFEEYGFSYQWRNEPGAGFSFPCDKDGNIQKDQMYPAGLENLEKCLSGEHDVIAVGVVKYVHSYTPSPWIECCGCDQRVDLAHDFTNTCRCGYEYNGFGQLLAPREQWGY